MTVNAINSISLATLSAIDGISRASLSAINGQTISAGFPSTPILDDFNRANANPLDGNWTQGFRGAFDGDLQVLSNACAWASGGASGLASATWDTGFAADQQCYLTITTRVGGSLHCIMLRAVNAGASNVTGYQILARTDTNDIRIVRIDSDSTGAVLDTIGQTIADGDALGCNVVGTVGQVYYKVGAGAWAAVGSPFDASAYTASGKVGIALYPSGSVCDDFGGGNS